MSCKAGLWKCMLRFLLYISSLHFFASFLLLIPILYLLDLVFHFLIEDAARRCEMGISATRQESHGQNRTSHVAGNDSFFFGLDAWTLGHFGKGVEAFLVYVLGFTRSYMIFMRPSPGRPFLSFLLFLLYHHHSLPIHRGALGLPAADESFQKQSLEVLVFFLYTI